MQLNCIGVQQIAGEPIRFTPIDWTFVYVSDVGMPR